ncbi:MAG: LLM class flavin-dependent oxidoreductase [Candidatus Rokubacteria bacterium]|nr:LLM class flavin-dependent oxidoreductase [Candidatus Rokubacteria bacterium]
MKFGLIVAGQYLRDGSPVVRTREMLEQVRLAGDLGFDSVWMVHHYLIEFQAFQPLPMLARMAAEAGSMELGTAIYVLPLQPPVEVAENFATLDAITGGRLIFGVAQGYREVEFEAMGVPRRERAARFEEGLQLITKLWTEPEVTFKGRFYQVDKASLAMQPTRKPRPPIWIGATADGGIERAAGLGDAWMIGPGVEFGKLRRQLDLYRGALSRLGRPLERDYPIFREVLVAPTDAEARDAARAHLHTKYEAYFSWGYVDTTFEDVVRDAFVVGDPDGCARQIQRYGEELGINYFLARVQWPGVSQDEALRGLRLFGERVMPALRRRDEHP